MTHLQNRCPNCHMEFSRESESGERVGYTLLGKGEELSLIRCAGCGRELPVPERATISVSVRRSQIQ